MQSFMSMNGEEMVEQRACSIKANMNEFTGARKIAQELVEMNKKDFSEWGIQRLNLPISVGRYKKGDKSKIFKTIEKKTNPRHDWLQKTSWEQIEAVAIELIRKSN